MRTMTSCKGPRPEHLGDQPLPHASCAVSFRPLSSISLAWKEEEQSGPCEPRGEVAGRPAAWKLSTWSSDGAQG